MELKAGYKNTEIGVIPKEWKVVKVDEVCSITTGDKNTQDRIDDAKYPFFVRSQTVERINSYSFDGESILTAGDGVGTGKIFHYINGKFEFHQRVYKMSHFVKDLNGFFFYLYFSNHFYVRIMQMTAKSSVDSVRREMIANMQIPLPPLPEQTAIATVLSDTDSLIQSLEKKITKKQLIKKGAMQKLLSPISPETGKPKDGWEEKTLGEIGEFKNGINKSIEDFGFGFPFVNLMDVFGITKISSNNHLGLINSTQAEKELYNLKKGDVLFIRSSVKPSGVGLTCVISKDLENTVFSGFIIRYRDKNYLSSEFKEHCFYSKYFRNQIISSSSVSANTNINQDALNKIKISFPKSKTEQTYIAQILSDMDSEIETLEKKLAKYKQLKQGLMQVLLTGKIRLLN